MRERASIVATHSSEAANKTVMCESSSPEECEGTRRKVSGMGDGGRNGGG